MLSLWTAFSAVLAYGMVNVVVASLNDIEVDLKTGKLSTPFCKAHVKQ